MQSLVTSRADCDICGFAEPDTVRCSGCHICFHTKCYGLINSPSGSRNNRVIYCQRCWFCKQTRTSPYEIKCFLCPVNHGAMKRANLPGLLKQVWVHIRCIIFQPFLAFKEDCGKNGTPLNKDLVLLTMNFQDLVEMWNRKCQLCNGIEGNAVNCCKKYGRGFCKKSFHVGCASYSLAKHTMALQHLQVECNKPNNQNDTVKLFCEQHLKQRLSDYRAKHCHQHYQTKNSFITNDILQLFQLVKMNPNDPNANDFASESIIEPVEVEKTQKVKGKNCRKSGKREISKKQEGLDEQFKTTSNKRDSSIKRRSSRLLDSKNRSFMKRRKANMRQIQSQQAQVIMLSDSSQAIQPQSIKSISRRQEEVADSRPDNEKAPSQAESSSAVPHEDCQFYYTSMNYRYQSPSWPSYNTLLDVIDQNDGDVLENLNSKLKK